MRYLIICLFLLSSSFIHSQEWIEKNFEGYLNPHQITTYNAQLEPIGTIDRYDLLPVQVIGKTLSTHEVDGELYCKQSHFFKIVRDGNHEIVLDKDLYAPSETYEQDELTLLVLEEKSFIDFDSGCLPSYFLAIKEGNEVNLIIEDEVEYEEPNYLYLNRGDAAYDKIESFTKNSNGYHIVITRREQDDYGKFNVQLVKKPLGWFAQTSEYIKSSEIEKEKNASYRVIENIAVRKYRKIIDGLRTDSLQSYVNDFSAYFNRVLKKNPDFIDYPFQKLSNEPSMYITSSNDDAVRFYTWNNQSGGSAQYYDGLYQVRSTQVPKTYKLDAGEGMLGYYVSKIHSVSTQYATYYIVITNEIFSHRDVAQTAMAYQLDNQNNKLVPVDLFATAKKTYKEITVQYNFFTAMESHPEERPIEVIKYDEYDMCFYFSLIGENGQYTSKNLVYEWNPELNKFKYIGIE